MTNYYRNKRWRYDENGCPIEGEVYHTIDYDCDRCFEHVTLDTMDEIKLFYDLGRLELCEDCLRVYFGPKVN